MRVMVGIACVFLTGCSMFSKNAKVEEPSKSSTLEAQSVVSRALERSLQSKEENQVSIQNALSAMNGISKLNIAEGNAKSAQLTNAETVNTVTRVASVGLALSFLAFLFGSYVGIGKIAASLSSVLCLSVAVAAPAILQALGTDAAQIVIVSCFAILALSAALSAAWLAVDKARDYAKKTR